MPELVWLIGVTYKKTRFAVLINGLEAYELIFSLFVVVAEVPRSRDLAILVVTTNNGTDYLICGWYSLLQW